MKGVGKAPRSVVLLLIACVMMSAARDARADDGGELTVSLLTFGPGDHPFSKFGHNGLLIENSKLGTRAVYNYGTFSFDSLWLIPKFMLGKYRYWLSVQTFEQTLATYAAENRSVVAQRLHLTGEQKRELAAFLVWNARDENKYYVFDYYRDNCATRIRDLIDPIAGGALARISSGPAEMTWRQHTMRLTADDLPVYFGLYVAMGSFIDQPIAVWQEMFLPAKLADGVRRTSAESVGGATGLVESETVLVRDRRPPPRATPPDWTGRSLLAGTLAAFLLGALGWCARSRDWARVALGILVAALGLVLGALGCLFVFLWVFTNHQVAYHNENILACAPFAVLLAGAGLGIARAKASAAARAYKLALAAFACAALGLVLKILPWFSQNNAEVLALVLPLWAGIAGASFFASLERGSRHLAIHQS